VSNSICDGTGGYIGADGNSQFFIISSTVNTQFISRGRAVLFAGLANLNLWPPEATGASVMILVFSDPVYEPQSRDTAVIFVSDFRLPAEAQVGTDVAVLGTADIRNGPFSPMAFGSYQMFYASADSPDVWQPIGPVHEQPVNRDTLDVWNTRDLTPGAYILKMRLKDTLGDSLEPTRGVYLNPTAIAEARIPAPKSRIVAAPNPFIAFSVIPGYEDQEFELYDAAGHLVAIERGAAVGRHAPAGVYWLRPRGKSAPAIRIVKVR
jgi:hypothetical protein